MRLSSHTFRRQYPVSAVLQKLSCSIHILVGYALPLRKNTDESACYQDLFRITLPKARRPSGHAWHQHGSVESPTLRQLGGPAPQLTPHEPRGGGATEHWLQQRDVPALRHRGCWTSERTSERSVQEEAFCLHALRLSDNAIRRSAPLLKSAGPATISNSHRLEAGSGRWRRSRRCCDPPDLKSGAARPPDQLLCTGSRCEKGSRSHQFRETSTRHVQGETQTTRWGCT